jgi:hypothetical protein
MNLEKLVKERIKENEKLFNEKELNYINNNVNIIKKLYILGMLDIEYKKFQKSSKI